MSKFRITRSLIPDVRIIASRRFDDDRGHFSETFSQAALFEDGFHRTFVQDNQSLSRRTGTLRGLHFQTSPFAQDKLVRVVAGSIWDVAVDLRRSSPTFKRWFGLELSADNGLQLLIPVGFAHGFLTLQPDTIVAYKVTAPYSGPHDAGVAWNDPDLAIHWPLPVAEPILSDKDQHLPRLAHAAIFD